MTAESVGVGMPVKMFACLGSLSPLHSRGGIGGGVEFVVFEDLPGIRDDADRGRITKERSLSFSLAFSLLRLSFLG